MNFAMKEISGINLTHEVNAIDFLNENQKKKSQPAQVTFCNYSLYKRGRLRRLSHEKEMKVMVVGISQIRCYIS